jgi:hypothetical protein
MVHHLAIGASLSSIRMQKTFIVCQELKNQLEKARNQVFSHFVQGNTNGKQMHSLNDNYLVIWHLIAKSKLFYRQQQFPVNSADFAQGI